ncbi:helix-turn-helix domain-containing protein [Nocardiopsis sp. EMB25]|uniref:helix-turn-helix domain-containing protein n=1 Tax=Nocardiopsis TaxID=2013 RepID=UPI000349944A|nr:MULTISPECIES: helix-turn-helix transcriptional regulator [Nocardiopsis]MCY9786190.1 helix-turn-helix domain-containing protein [Nocardiopsis sp. EMB25]
MNTPPRRTLSDLKSSERFDRPAVREAYELTRLRFELAETVRLRREELGWSQSELGRRAGMPQSSVARFEHGGTQPTLPTLERLADALGLVLHVCMENPETRDRGLSHV